MIDIDWQGQHGAIKLGFDKKRQELCFERRGTGYFWLIQLDDFTDLIKVMKMFQEDIAQHCLQKLANEAQRLDLP